MSGDLARPDMRATRRRAIAIGALIALVAIVLDQASKTYLIATLLNPPHTMDITGFFRLVPWWNRGVSFGLLASDQGWASYALSGVAALVLIGLVLWLGRSERPLLAVAQGLVIGGAIGNVIDRLRFGAVFDFLYFHAGPYDFPAFNLADSAITLGVALLLWDGLFGAGNRAKNAANPSIEDTAP
jgi:signal peptidase II